MDPMIKMVPNTQTAYHARNVVASANVDEDIAWAMRLYLTKDLGLDGQFAALRATRELAREIPAAVVTSLSACGIDVANIDVLDLGAGLGAMSEELVLRGAKVVAIEPGAAWADLAKRRVERHHGHFTLLQSFGESIPLPSASFDLVVSLQVLEHVKSPNAVLEEVWRLLRPGGHFYLACENYLAFREAHYQVPWLPLLPKWIGGLYLSLLGRSPRFLYDAITYTTYPGVLRKCRQIGFVRRRDEDLIAKIQIGTGPRWTFLRIMTSVIGRGVPLFLARIKVAFRFGIYELFRKPFLPRPSSPAEPSGRLPSVQPRD